MPVAFRVVDRLTDLSDVSGTFDDGEVPTRSGSLFVDRTPLTIPFVSTTSGNSSVPLDLTHTLDDSAFGASSANHPDFHPLRLTGSVQPVTANITTATDLIYGGPRFRTVYGSALVDARGTARALTVEYDLLGAAQTGSEHFGIAGYLRAGTAAKAPVARTTFQSISVHGPIGAQAGLLNGITALVNKYHNSVPTGGSAAGFWSVTRPGSGHGNDAGQSAATSYAMDVGMGVAGFAGVPAGTATRGFHTAFKAGGRGSGWMGAGETSILGTGLEITDVEEAGVKLYSPLSGSALNPKGIWFSADTGGKAWDWLMFFQPGAANTPATGALQLPATNTDRGQIRWGDSPTTAPRLYRSADYTLMAEGAFRVTEPNGSIDPIAAFGSAANDTARAVDVQNVNTKLRLFVCQSSGNNQYVTGTVPGDAGIVSGAGGLVFGNIGTGYGALRSGQWGFGTTAPSAAFHVASSALFAGQARFNGAVPAASTNAGVYLGLASTTPRVRLGDGTAAQDWTIDNVTGAMSFQRNAVETLQLTSTQVKLQSVALVQGGAALFNSFAGHLTVSGNTTLGTASGLVKRTTGLIGTAVAGTDYEVGLGNPGASGSLLSSTVTGTRSWVTAASLSSQIDHNQATNLATGDVHTQYAYKTPATTARNTIQPSAATATALTLKGHGSQSAAFFSITTSADVAQFRGLVGGHWEVASEVRWLKPGGGNYIALKAPALSGNLTWTWPATEGTAGQVLTWNTGGALTWADPAGAGDISGAVALAPATTARNVVQSSAADATQLTLKGHATQSVAFFSITDSADANLFRVLVGGHGELAGTLRLVETGGGTEYISLGAPAAVGTSIDYKLPATISAGEFLTTDASGNLAWDTPSGSIGAAAILAPDGATRNLVQATGDFSGLILKESAGGQTVPLLLLTDDADVTVASVSAAGAAVFASVSAAVVASALTVGTLNGLLKAATGVVSAAAAGTDYEAALGNPASDDYLLKSAAAGTRAWVNPATIMEPPLGNPAGNGYLLSSTTGGSRSWVDPTTLATGTVLGSGTAGVLAVWTDTDTLGDSVARFESGALIVDGPVAFGRDQAPPSGAVAEFYSDPLTPKAVWLAPLEDTAAVPGAVAGFFSAYVTALDRPAYHDGLTWQAIARQSEVPTALVNLTGRDQDVLPNHLYTEGRNGGQYLAGGTQMGDILSVLPTTHPGGGIAEFATILCDTMNGRIGFNQSGPAYEFDFGPGQMRVPSLGDGFVYASGGVLGTAVPPGDSQWTRDAGNSVVYPATTTDKVSIGSATQAINSRFIIKNLAPTLPILVLQQASGQSTDMLRLVNNAGTGTLAVMGSDGRYAFGATVAHASSVMDLNSTAGGFNPPQMTEAQYDAIPSKKSPCLAWLTDLQQLAYWDGAAKQLLTASGGGGGGPTTLFTETFEGGSASMHGSTSTTGSKTCTVHHGTFTRNGSGVGAWTGAVGAVQGRMAATWNSGESDVRIRMTITTLDGNPGVSFRLSDANNFLYCRYQLGSARYQCAKIVAGGTPAQIFVTSGVTPTVGDELEIRCNASGIECFVNGVSRGSASDSFNQTATNHGVMDTNDSFAGRVDNVTCTTFA